MEVKELRIGNYVSDVSFSYTHTVMEILFIEERGSEMDRDHLDGISKINRVDSSYYQGIPLTEEWLVKFGFENDEFNRFMVKPYRTVLQGVFPGRWQVYYLDTLPFSFPNSIQYVHQLQNLYFALTGEELTLKTT